MVQRLMLEIIVDFPAGVMGGGRGGVWLRCDVMLTSFLHHPDTSQYYTETGNPRKSIIMIKLTKNIDPNINNNICLKFSLLQLI